MVAADNTPDAELIARAISGRDDAFDALVRRYYRTAFAVALAYTANEADAEDVCHDAFIAAAAKLEQCRVLDRFRQWLSAIVRNQARNAAEREKVRRTEVLDPEAAPAADDPSRDTERGELREQLTDALRTLTAVQREIVLLHDLDGWPHADIAESLGMSVESSRQHLFNARRQLRLILGSTT